jgi:hypothetical protein
LVSIVVGLHHGAELRQRQFLDGPHALDPGIVDQHVDRAELPTDPRYPVANRGVGINIHCENADRETLTLGGLAKCRSIARVPHGGGDPMPGSAKRKRRGHADTGTGAGDKDNSHFDHSEEEGFTNICSADFAATPCMPHRLGLY